MNVASGFIPRPESSRGDIGPDAFFGSPLEGEFPIVNRSSAVDGKVGDPAAFDQSIRYVEQSVLHEMRSVNQHHTDTALSGGGDFFNAFADLRLNLSRTGWSGPVGINQKSFDGAQAFPLCERIDFDFVQLKRSWELIHVAAGLKHEADRLPR